MCLHILYCDLTFISRDETKLKLHIYQADIVKEQREKEIQNLMEKQKALEYKKTYKPR